MPIQGYEASVEAAKRALEAAQCALPRDIAQAVANAGWAAFLRDKHDVQALVDHIGEAVQQHDFVSKLHAAADKARHQQPHCHRSCACPRSHQSDSSAPPRTPPRRS